MMTMSSRSRLVDAKAAALGLVRQHGRGVLWTDSWMGFGNLLYRYLHAWTQRAQGREEWVLEAPSAALWMDVFPALQELTLPRRQLSWRDRRDLEDYQGFGTSFTRDELASFSRDCLLSGHLPLRDDPGGVTINVRRGDFYSDRWRPLYGFDVTAYVRRALAVAQARAPFEHAQVVSDDLDWCTRHLVDLDVELVPVASGGPVGDLATLTSAGRLVLANSTFSYWAGFLSNAVHGDNHDDVLAPRFHRRDINGGESWHLDPRWVAIDDPHGWPPA